MSKKYIWYYERYYNQQINFTYSRLLQDPENRVVRMEMQISITLILLFSLLLPLLLF